MTQKENVEVQVTFCHFPQYIATNKFYTCFKQETCCDQGCCSSNPHQIYQVWYYWLLFLVIFGLISGGSWLCKKPREVPSPDDISPPSSPSYRLARCSRRRCPRNFDSIGYRDNRHLNDCDDDIILDRLFVSFRNRNMLADPPSYSSIIPVNYNNFQSKFCPLYSYYGPPPTYSSMYKSDGSNVLVERGEPVTVSTAAIAGSVAHIQIHAEENRSEDSAPNVITEEEVVTSTTTENQTTDTSPDTI